MQASAASAAIPADNPSMLSRRFSAFVIITIHRIPSRRSGASQPVQIGACPSMIATQATAICHVSFVLGCR